MTNGDAPDGPPDDGYSTTAAGASTPAARVVGALIVYVALDFIGRSGHESGH